MVVLLVHEGCSAVHHKLVQLPVIVRHCTLHLEAAAWYTHQPSCLLTADL